MRLVPVLCALLAGCSFGAAAGTGNDDGVDASGPAPDAQSHPNPAPDAAATATGPYPIILAHGAFGFDHIGPLDYFDGVVDLLHARGRAVYAPRVDPLQSSAVRGAQLAAIVDQVLAETGASKVVIIAHSQGGMDARWVAHYAPSKVAAVVTIATPNHGTPVANVLQSVVPGQAAAVASAMADFLGVAVSSSDLQAQLAGFTTSGIAAFNAEITDGPGVAYYSIAGRSALATSASCPTSTPFLAKWNRYVDDMAPEISALGAIIAAAQLPAIEPQDGLVPVASAKWGTFLGCIPADHLDEVGQIAGRPAGIANPFDHLEFYGDLESFLAHAGF